MLKEFKEFISKGNVLDLAVAVIIAGAFGKIVASFVNDVLMPIIGMAMGGKDFSNLFVALDGNTYETLAAAKEAGAGVLAYGTFVQTIIDFLIVAFVIFLIVKAYNKTKAPEAPAAPAGPTQEELLTQIRDLLKK